MLIGKAARGSSTVQSASALKLNSSREHKKNTAMLMRKLESSSDGSDGQHRYRSVLPGHCRKSHVSLNCCARYADILPDSRLPTFRLASTHLQMITCGHEALHIFGQHIPFHIDKNTVSILRHHCVQPCMRSNPKFQF